MAKQTPQEKALSQEAQQFIQDEMFVTQTEAYNLKLGIRVKNALNARYYPKTPEVNSTPSMTIPDQSMPLKTILERYARGLPIEGGVQPIQQDDLTLQGIDLRKLDLSEREAVLDSLRIRIAELQGKLAQEKAVPASPAPSAEIS